MRRKKVRNLLSLQQKIQAVCEEMMKGESTGIEEETSLKEIHDNASEAIKETEDYLSARKRNLKKAAKIVAKSLWLAMAIAKLLGLDITEIIEKIVDKETAKIILGMIKKEN